MSFSSAARHSARLHRDRSPAPPRVLALIAPSSSVETGGIPNPPLPAPRFSQPPSGSDDGTDLRVYSTPLALQGFEPSELDSGTIGGRLRPRASSPLPALHGFLPHHERHLLLSPPRRYCPSRLSPRRSPSSPCGDRLPSWAQADPEALRPFRRAAFPGRFHPTRGVSNSPGLLSFRVFLPGRPGPYGPPLLRFESRCKVLLRPEMTSPCGDISPPGVFAL